MAGPGGPERTGEEGWGARSRRSSRNRRSMMEEEEQEGYKEQEKHAEGLRARGVEGTGKA